MAGVAASAIVVVAAGVSCLGPVIELPADPTGLS